MNQRKLAQMSGRTKEHFNAVIRGRVDAGKDLAVWLSKNIGGQVDIWLCKSGRKDRKAIVDSYLDAFRRARQA